MKKIIASVVAVTIAFGGLALPAAESGLSFSAAISASADESTAADFNYTVLSDGTLKITKYKGKADNVVIPETIDGKKVTVIGTRAFYDYTRKKQPYYPLISENYRGFGLSLLLVRQRIYRQSETVVRAWQ